MSKASKRERQRLNREMRRELEVHHERRRKQWRFVRNAAFVVVPLIALIVIINLVRDDDNGGEDGSENVEEQAGAPAVTIDPAKKYVATIDTDGGQIVIDLDAANAPVSVNNFVHLARNGFYDGLSWHRAAAGFVIQGGDPNGDGTGGPGYTVEAETPPNGYTVGSVAWAKGGAEPAGTAGSQFFVVTSDGPGLQQALNVQPYQYGYLGQVTAGLDVAQRIEALAPPDASGQPGDGPPTRPVLIDKITITEDGVALGPDDDAVPRGPAATTTTAPPASTPPEESTPPSS